MNIVVSGGASGLGKAITLKLLEDKTNVVLFSYCNSKESAMQMEKDFINARSFYLNFDDVNSIKEFTAALSAFNPDALVNNALSGFNLNYFHKIDTTAFLESFRMNIWPTLCITQEAIKLFRKKKSGRIVTVLTAGLIDCPPLGWSEYTANKAYIHSMVKSWAIENAGFNITSNAISPAVMDTKLTMQIDSRLLETANEQHPLKKILSTSEVADTVDFLLKSSLQINGINLIMNAAAHVV